MTEEREARGIEGHLLYDPRTEEYFFRVYDQPPVVDQPAVWHDYRLAAESIKIVITDGAIALKDGKLGWCSRYIGQRNSTK